MNKTKMDTSDMDKKIHYMDNCVYIFASKTEKCSYKSIFHLRIPNRMHFMGKKMQLQNHYPSQSIVL